MNKKAFTLVELIVVITILAILATIGFVSFSGYLAGTRDTNRVAQLKSMSDALELYRTKKSLPIPDDKVDVKSSGSVIAYQGYIGKNVLETIEYAESGLDPKDKNYFSYYLTKNKKYFQLMAFLEEENEDVQASRDVSLKHLSNNNTDVGDIHLYNSTFATDYSDRYTKTTGKKLGILTDKDNTPIQEVSAITSSGYLDISTTINEYIANFGDNYKLIGTGTKLAVIKNINNVGGTILSNCKKILDQKSSAKGNNGNYLINPEGNKPFQVFCDMTTDGGGWTRISEYKKSPNYYKSLGINIKGSSKIMFEYTRDNGTKGPFRLGIDKINITADGYSLNSIQELGDLISLNKIGGPKRGGGTKSGIWSTRIITGGDVCIDKNNLNLLPNSISWGSCLGSGGASCTPIPGNIIFENGNNLTLISNRGLFQCNGNSYSNGNNDFINVYVK